MTAEQAELFALGSDAVFDLGDAVLKLTTPRWAGQIEREALFLRGIAGALPVETPRVIAVGELEGWPYAILSRLRGEPLQDLWPNLAADLRRDVAAQIGTLMSALHAQVVPDLPAPDWGAFVADQRAGAVAHHRKRGADEAWLAELARFLAEAPDPHPPPLYAVPLHTELLGAHLIVQRQSEGWRITGLIDFADGMNGPADYDVAAPVEFIFGREPGLLRICLEAYGWPPERLTAAEGRRLLACALLHRYASLPRMLAAAGVLPDDPPDFPLLRRRLFALEVEG